MDDDITVRTTRVGRREVVTVVDGKGQALTMHNAGGRVCEFCRVGEVLWRYKSVGMYDSEGTWHPDVRAEFYACGVCGAAVNARDLDTLFTRADRALKFLPHARPMVIRHHGHVVDGIVERQWLGPEVAYTPIEPRDVPRYRDGVVRLWLLAEALRYLNRVTEAPPGLPVLEQPELNDDGKIGDDAFVATIAGYMRIMHDQVKPAGLYWMSSDFSTLAVNAARDLPDSSLKPEDIPAESGFLAWGAPVCQRAYLDENENPGPVEVAAVHWCRTDDGLWITPYARITFAPGQLTESEVQDYRRQAGWLHPIGFGFYIRDDGSLMGVPDDEPVARIVAASLLLLAQPGVAAVSEREPEKKERRNAARAGIAVPVVKLVNLRRSPRRQGEREASASGWTVGVRFVVRGHWRDQAYGEGRRMRRRRYIEPFLKGPDEAPFKKSTSVNVLR